MSRALYIAGFLFGIAAAIVLFRFMEPGEINWLPKCFFHQLTGLHCPGCGATRAVHELVNGDPIAAIGYNPLLVLGGPVLAVLIWRRRGKERLGIKVSPTFCWVLFSVLVVWFVIRNVPSPTTSWFAPGNPTLYIFTPGSSD